MRKWLILGIIMILIIGMSYKPELKVVIKEVIKEVPVFIKADADLTPGPVVTEVLGTMYNPVVAQCDADPLITADNSKIDLDKLDNNEIRWVALSRDLLTRWGGPYNYGDSIYVHHSDKRIKGIWIVHDTMNARWSKRIDFLVSLKHTKIFPHKTPHILISNQEFYVTR